jgi:hypothetical protein
MVLLPQGEWEEYPVGAISFIVCFAFVSSFSIFSTASRLKALIDEADIVRLSVFSKLKLFR